MSKILCTLAVLTYNNESSLNDALESAKDFEEIIVCDGGSRDHTLDIARAYGARVILQDFVFKNEEGKIVDFGGIRNQTLKASTQDWFFFLDSDELLTEELVKEIKRIIDKNEVSAWWVDRKYSIDGKIIDCSATYPTRQMRFFHKSAVTEFIKPIHERINPISDAVIKKTENFMLVPVSADPRVWREKWKHYISLEIGRRGKISFWDWLEVCMENAKVSFLYSFRLIRNSFFCRGTKMPIALEWERHVYHLNLCKGLWSKVGK